MPAKKALIAIFLLSQSFVCFAQFSEAIEKTTTIVDELQDTYPGLSIAVGVEDKIVWSQGFGYSNTEEKIPTETSNQFRYYSLSKSITGMALVKLIESGDLEIDNPVKYYLPDLPETYDSVKVRHLINHTAGVRHYDGREWNAISQDHCELTAEALPVFIYDPLEATPGQTFSYTSFGYVLLSNLIETVSGQGYADFVSSQLLVPYNLQSIAMDGSPALKNEVRYYDKWNSKKEQGKEAESVDNSCKFGGGGFVGTAEDIVKLQLEAINQQVFTRELTELYYTQLSTDAGEETGYAFGIGDRTNDSGVRYHVHTGSARGANAVLLIYPEYKIVVALLGNVNDNTMNSRIGEIASLFIRKEG